MFIAHRSAWNTRCHKFHRQMTVCPASIDGCLFNGWAINYAIWRWSARSQGTGCRGGGCRGASCGGVGCQGKYCQSASCRSTRCRYVCCRSVSCRGIGCRTVGWGDAGVIATTAAKHGISQSFRLGRAGIPLPEPADAHMLCHTISKMVIYSLQPLVASVMRGCLFTPSTCFGAGLLVTTICFCAND